MTARVTADGKHLMLQDERFSVRGVTYGSFLPRGDGAAFPEEKTIHRDFASMVALGLNTVRIYSAPSIDLLDAAADKGLRLIVGLDYCDWRYESVASRSANGRVLRAGRQAVEQVLSRCAGRPEVLAISVGNEVPADVVRVHGMHAVQDVLSTLANEVSRGDRNALVTYTNFPTTEYLDVEGLDLACFNVFLERPEQLRRYLRHLMTITESLPLVVTELGLASEVAGEDAQARSLAWQLRLVDETGCAGASVFAWTDEWGVGGRAVEGWGFGITTVDRRQKAAAAAVSGWANTTLKDLRLHWPRVSVVVCAFNEEANIEQCLLSLERCDYPDLEVIVCDDGSTDRTLEIAERFPFKLLRLFHGGLSNARNAGIETATGDVVAFLDADAACHPQWPWYLVLSLDDPKVVATGGPNLPFPDAEVIERVVSYSPGAPTEVLITDDRAEHVPGCNMAFTRDALLAVGGFDPIYTSAGDDVDICWKLLDEGWEIAFAPAAQVRHHRRPTIRGYLRQQRGYGRAERLLWASHPHRFNRLGQPRWTGFIYGGVRLLPRLLRPVVYHGHQGRAPFQSIDHRPSETVPTGVSALLPLTIPIAVVSLLAGLLWPPALLIAAGSVEVVLAFFLTLAFSVRLDEREPHPLKMRGLVGVLHVLQPVVRMWGRLMTRPRHSALGRKGAEWDGDRSSWLQELERQLRRNRARVKIGGVRDTYDLEISRGPFACAQVTTAVTWNWIPHWRVRSRLRWGPLLVAMTVAAVLAPFNVVAAAAACASVLVIAAVDVFAIRLSARRSVLRSLASIPRVGDGKSRSRWL